MTLTENVLLVCASHRGLEAETFQSVEACKAPFVRVQGVADVALARNRALTLAVEEAQQSGADTIVLLDDDMVFTPEQVNELVEHSRSLHTAVSAMYVLKGGDLAASRHGTVPVVGEPWMSQRWLCGLGLMAIPLHSLLKLAHESEQVSADGTITAFTWTGTQGAVWMSEDCRLCERLGGAILAPVAVGHVKKMTLIPDAQSVQKLALGESL